MLEISLSCLTSEKTRQKFATAVRDRALYLLPLATAFRGDNVRSLALSDLFAQPVINGAIGINKEIMV